MSVVLDVRQKSESTVSPYRRTRCVPPGVGAARGVLEAAAAAADEEERMADPVFGGRPPRADLAGVRAMAVVAEVEEAEAPVISSVME